MICRVFETNQIECTCNAELQEWFGDYQRVHCVKRGGFKPYHKIKQRFLTDEETNKIKEDSWL